MDERERAARTVAWEDLKDWRARFARSTAAGTVIGVNGYLRAIGRECFVERINVGVLERIRVEAIKEVSRVLGRTGGAIDREHIAADLIRARRIDRRDCELIRIRRRNRTENIGKRNGHRRVAGAIGINLPKLTDLLCAGADRANIEDLTSRTRECRDGRDENERDAETAKSSEFVHGTGSLLHYAHRQT